MTRRIITFAIALFALGLSIGIGYSVAPKTVQAESYQQTGGIPPAYMVSGVEVDGRECVVIYKPYSVIIYGISCNWGGFSQVGTVPPPMPPVSYPPPPYPPPMFVPSPYVDTGVELVR